MACLDMSGKMTAATSTVSGLFMKKKAERDSPISGSGFYAGTDSKRRCRATGLGEDLMKGCISMKSSVSWGGMHPQKACETAVVRLDAELKERRGEAGIYPL